MSFRVSKWLIPDKYFVSFPYGIYDANILRKKRHMLRSSKPYVITYEGKSVADGLHTAFTFDRDVFVYARREVRKYKTELDEIFKSVTMDEPTHIELPWYHQVDNWESYRNYLASEEQVSKHMENANGILTFQKKESQRSFTGVGSET